MKIKISKTLPVRLVAVAAAIMFIGLSGLGQTHYSSNVSIGAKGGLGMSRIFFNPSVKQDFKMGPQFGFMFRYIEESHFGIIAELDYSSRGWKENFEGAPFAYSRTLDYLELPVLAHIYFGRRGRFFVNAGPQVGLRLSSKVKADFDPLKAPELEGFPKYHQTHQYEEPLKQRFDYGIAAGVGGEFSINRRNALMLECRFYYGLGNLFSAARRDYFNASNSMTLGVTLGYWFRIK